MDEYSRAVTAAIHRYDDYRMIGQAELWHGNTYPIALPKVAE